MEKKGQKTTSIRLGDQKSKVGFRKRPAAAGSQNTNRAVVLLSGGIDSATTLAYAKSEGYKLYALSFDYGQRHGIELGSAKKVAQSLKAKKHLIIKFNLREIGGSALTAEMEVPKRSAEVQKSRRTKVKGFTDSPIYRFAVSSIPITYVPARNTIFLSFALAWAELLKAENIFIGANAVDYSGYPDCRPEYLKAFEDMANLATKEAVEGRMRFRINAPLINMTKAEVIKKGIELGLDYALTWSCYDPQPKSPEARMRRSPEATSRLSDLQTIFVPCGKCDSCVFRAKGFKEAQLKDPLLR